MLLLPFRREHNLKVCQLLSVVLKLLLATASLVSLW